MSDQKTEQKTLRDEFAMAAPHEPQDWFEPTLKQPRPDRPLSPKDPSKDEKDELIGLSGNYLRSGDCQQPRVRAYAEAMDEYRPNLRRWEIEREKQRHIQWPFAWADAMLAARTQEPRHD